MCSEEASPIYYQHLISQQAHDQNLRKCHRFSSESFRELCGDRSSECKLKIGSLNLNNKCSIGILRCASLSFRR